MLYKRFIVEEYEKYCPCPQWIKDATPDFENKSNLYVAKLNDKDLTFLKSYLKKPDKIENELMFDVFQLIIKYCPTQDYKNYGKYFNQILDTLFESSKTSST